MDQPLYTSPPTAKSLWQEFRIHEDRLELATHLGILTIPFDHVERTEVQGSDLAALLRGDLRLEDFRPAVKLDWANFVEHVVVDRSTGFARRILFSPADPEAFHDALEQALATWREAG